MSGRTRGARRVVLDLYGAALAAAALLAAPLCWPHARCAGAAADCPRASAPCLLEFVATVALAPLAELPAVALPATAAVALGLARPRRWTAALGVAGIGAWGAAGLVLASAHGA